MRGSLATALALILGAGNILAYVADDTAKTVSSDGSESDTIAALEHVQLNQADGWVITVGNPGGSYTWTSPIYTTISYNTTIQGATSSTRDSTTRGFVDNGCPSITFNTSPLANILLGLRYAPGKLITIKNFKFPPTNASYSDTSSFFVFNGSGPTAGFRVTNCKFDTGSGREQLVQIAAIGPYNGYGDTTDEGPYGLFDHCTVNGGGFHNYENSTDGTSRVSWRRPATWGTEKALYLEDCIFYEPSYGASATDPYFGSRTVIRHCTLENYWIGDHGADRGYTSLGGPIQREIMHNTFVLTELNRNIPRFIAFRGSTGVVFDNTFQVVSNTSEANVDILWVYFRADYWAKNGIFDMIYAPLNTTIASGSNGQTLPQATINVTSADTWAGTSYPYDGYTTIRNLKITTSAGIQTVTCTSLLGNAFGGCTGGTGTMTTGGAVARASDYVGTMQPCSGYTGTTVAVGSNGQSLPQGTISVASTALFPANGNATVNGSTIAYIGKTATTLTGCTGGSGTMATGQVVNSIGQDPNNPTEPWGRVPSVQWSNTLLPGGTIYRRTDIQVGAQGFVTLNRDLFDYGSSAKPSSTGQWFDTYAEYTYPHPLQGVTGALTPVTSLRSRAPRRTP